MGKTTKNVLIIGGISILIVSCIVAFLLGKKDKEGILSGEKSLSLISANEIGDNNDKEQPIEDIKYNVDEEKESRCQEEFKKLNLGEYFGAFYSPVVEKCIIFGQLDSDKTVNFKDELPVLQEDLIVDLKNITFVIKDLETYKKSGLFAGGHLASYSMYQIYDFFDYNDYNKGGRIKTFCNEKSDFNPNLSRDYDYSCNGDVLEVRAKWFNEIEILKGSVN